MTPFDAVACSNVNAAWGALTLEVLVRLGVETVVISPGSRSTALTMAAARNPRIDAVALLDERSAGFFALGLAKRTRKPVVLICTSGSAAANYFPAVVEASMSGTPLLVLTADRPAELRNCSSGQTVDQLKMYGDYVRSFYEVALPEVDMKLFAYLRQTLVHAVDRALNGDPGPVHLNFPFRDPLTPSENGEPVVDGAVLESAATVLTRACEAVRCGGGFDAVAIERMASHQHGLIVVGSVNPREGDEVFADSVAMLSRKLGWPVLSDILNPLRGHAGEIPDLLTHYDASLGGGEAPAPAAVLQIGALPTSKVLRAWLDGLDAVTFLLSDRPVNLDPLHRVSAVLRGEAHDLAELVPHQKVDLAWIASWSTLEQRTAQRLNAELARMEQLFEGKVAWLLSQHVPIGTPVFLASSMSVRYAEYFWNAGSRACSVFANRGANGIDGTLSTAMGVAHGGKPAILLTGDLAFLHDANGLLAAGRLDGSLTVVLINNEGGGIFEHLPVAALEASFEEFFATPQAVNIAQLCRAHGVAHSLVSDWAEFLSALTAPAAPGVRVIEVPTDRKIDRQLLAQMLRA